MNGLPHDPLEHLKKFISDMNAEVAMYELVAEKDKSEIKQCVAVRFRQLAESINQFASANRQVSTVFDWTFNFFLSQVITYKQYLNASVVDTYLAGVNALFGWHTYFHALVRICYTLNDTRYLESAVSNRKEEARQYFFHLLERLGGKPTKGAIDSLCCLARTRLELDPLGLTIQNYQTLARAKISLDQPGLFTRHPLLAAQEDNHLELYQYFISGQSFKQNPSHLVHALFMNHGVLQESILQVPENLQIACKELLQRLARDRKSLSEDERRLLIRLVISKPMLEPSELNLEILKVLEELQISCLTPQLFKSSILASAILRQETELACRILENAKTLDELQFIPIESARIFFVLMISALFSQAPYPNFEIVRELAKRPLQINPEEIPAAHYLQMLYMLDQNKISIHGAGLFSAPLFPIAARRNDHDTAAFLIQKNADLSQCSSELMRRFFSHVLQVAASQTSHAAAICIQVLSKMPLEVDPECVPREVWIRLLGQGFKFNKPRLFLKPLLLHAFQRGDEELIKALLKSEAPIGVLFNPFVDSSVCRFFSISLKSKAKGAVYEVQRNVIQKLIDLGAVVDDECEFEESLLAKAIDVAKQTLTKVQESQNFLEYVQTKLRFRYDRRNSSGQDLLLWSIERNRPNVFHNLLELNAPVNAVDHRGHGAVHYVIRSGSNEFVRALLKKEVDDWNISVDGMTALHVAMDNNDEKNIQALMQKGVDIKAPHPKTGETLLIWAIRKKCKCLIQKALSSDLNVKDKKGKTALAYAFDNEDIDLMMELLRKGAEPLDFKKVDPPLAPGVADRPREIYEGDSMLIYAAKVKHLDLLELLIQAGASIDMANNAGETLLHYAVKTRGNRLFEFALLKNANVNAKNNDGNTPLAYSLSLGAVEMSLALLDHKASLYEHNEFGFPPIAVLRGTANARAALYRTAGLAEQPVDNKQVLFKILEQSTLGKYLIQEYGSSLTCEGIIQHIKTHLLPLANEDGAYQQMMELALSLSFKSLFFLVAEKINDVKRVAGLFAPLVHANKHLYPTKYWLEFLIHTEQKHMAVQVAFDQDVQLPDGQEIDIRLLLHYFDSINIADPKAPDYINPATFHRGKFKEERVALRKHLEELITQVIERKSTRKFKDPENDFKTLQSLLQSIAYRCQQWTDARQRAIFIVDVAKEAENCGVGWMLTAANLKTLLDMQTEGKIKDLSLETYLYKALMMLRAGILEKLSGANTHRRNQWLQAIGRQINVPEAKNLGQFQDGYGYQQLNPELCLEKFLRAYNAPKICAYATAIIKSKFKQDRQETDHSPILAWFEAHVPADYKLAFYQRVDAEIRQGGTPWQDIFKANNIEFAPAETNPAEALQKARCANYISTEVFPNFSETPELAAVVHLLSQLHVLQECLPGIVNAVAKQLKAAAREQQRASDKRKSDFSSPQPANEKKPHIAKDEN